MGTDPTGSDATSGSSGAGRPPVPPGRAFEPAYGGRLSRYGKRADLIVHEEEPFNAETRSVCTARHQRPTPPPPVHELPRLATHLFLFFVRTMYLEH
jgi:hypothetical protein